MALLALFTDFGHAGPYIGQMQAVLYQHAPQVPVVNLFADVPAFNPRAAAYLLAAFQERMPPGTVYLCVVDPGVGTDSRLPVAVCADGVWFVGPDNGLFQIVGQRAAECLRREIVWRPPQLSNSFHGRDLYAPIAAWIASGCTMDHKLGPVRASFTAPEPWPEDLAEVIYIDHYGNAVTGLRSSSVTAGQVVLAAGLRWPHARTFGDVPKGRGFWFANANGLVELAVNCGSAASGAGIQVGDGISIEGNG